MSKRDSLNKAKEIINQSINNVDSDKEISLELIEEVFKILKAEPGLHVELGPIMSKYMDNSQRATEQKIKLVKEIIRISEHETDEESIDVDFKEDLMDE